MTSGSESAPPGGKARQAAVTEDEAGVRLDRWFRRHYPSLTHGGLQKLLRTGQVRVDGKRADASDRLEPGQIIRLPPQLSEDNVTPNKAMASRAAERLRNLILYQDDEVLVLNKPAGLAVQGGTGLKENLDDMLASLSEGGQRPKLVHRLDRATSGVLLVARTDFAAARLGEAFRDRATRKIYWAITLGVPQPEQGEIDVPLIKQGEAMRVAEEGEPDSKSAVTLYQTVEKAQGKAAFVALWPITGRTHQLRVHLAHSGTPILGDTLYSRPEQAEALPLKELGSGLHLHARRLTIPHPRRGTLDITAPLGKAMKKTWRWFGFDEGAEVAWD